MRVGLLSDIHANWSALQAVWQDIKGQGLDCIYSLGDNVGYGPDPQAVTAFLYQQGVLSVQGNHEQGLIDPGCLAWFNAQARQALEQTSSLIDPEWIRVLAEYPKARVVHGARLVHGCPPESAFRYLFEWPDGLLPRLFATFEETLCFVGHTHELAVAVFKHGRAWRSGLAEGTYRLEQDARYLLNIGSVGQPRDGDNRAKYAIWDTVQASVEIRFVPYDIQDTVYRIKARGLSLANAERLW
jgi:diadenosine tetraphosphatase ApaH/serine/threonine PP2A family protein phosphatase